jgi:hypothetical protein
MLLALFGYAGPCLTPTEVESHKHAAVIAYANLLNLPAPPNLIAQARRNALEEAAQEIKMRGEFWSEGINHDAKIRADECQKIEAAIRALG